MSRTQIDMFAALAPAPPPRDPAQVEAKRAWLVGKIAWVTGLQAWPAELDLSAQIALDREVKEASEALPAEEGAALRAAFDEQSYRIYLLDCEERDKEMGHLPLPPEAQTVADMLAAKFPRLPPPCWTRDLPPKDG